MHIYIYIYIYINDLYNTYDPHTAYEITSKVIFLYSIIAQAHYLDYFTLYSFQSSSCQFLSSLQTRSDIANFIQIIMQFVKSKDQDLALKASLAIGRLCIVDSEARDHLYTRLRDVSFSVRAKVGY